jgi:hypothetical protein
MSANVSEGVRPRPLWQVLLIGLAVGGWLLLALLHLDVRYGRMALPVTVSVEAQGPLGPDDVKLGWEFRRGDLAPFRRGYTMHGVRVWRLRQAWIASLLLAGEPATLERLEKVTVEIGEGPEASRLETWPSQWTSWPQAASPGLPDGWQVRQFSANPARPRSLSSSFEGLLNYPGDAWLLRRALAHPVFLTFLGLFALMLVARYRLSRKPAAPALLEAVVPGGSGIASGESSEAASGRPARSGAWLLAGLAVLVIAGTVAETLEPYYFTQDDNYSQFFPGMLYGCRSLFAGGFANWNPHQFLGAPLAEVGTYALTYPFTYLSYALATYLLGDELATVEVFCWLHLVGGFAALFWLGRRLRLSPPISAAMALSFVLSGYALIGGRSWFYMVPTFLWAPLLGISVHSLVKRDPTRGWLLGTGVVIGLYFHAGNAQMWAYGTTFFCLALLWCATSGSIPWSRVIWALGGVAVGIGLAAPLLVPQFMGIRDLYRVGGGGGNALAGLHAMLAPYPLAKAEAPADLGTMYLDYFGQLYYAGSLFTLAWLAGLLAAWMYPGRVRRLLANPLFALGLVALLLCIGEAGVLWYVQAKLPVFNKFKHPVKILPFFHLFSIAFGALVVHRLVLRSQRPGRWRVACFLVVSVLLIYHVSLARTSFYSFGDRPYPEMPEPIMRVLKRGDVPVRVMPVAQARSTAKNYTLSLTNSFASVYGIDCYWGHDPLVSFRPEFQRIERRAEADMLDTLRRVGVAYLLVHSTSDSPVLSVNPAVRWQETRNLHILEPVRSYYAARKPLVEAGDLRLFELDGADPMAFPVDDREYALPMVRIPSGVKVDVAGLLEGGEVVINYLWYEGIRVRADGRPLPSRADPFGRIQANAPPGTQTLTVHYHSPWLAGIAVGLLIVAAGVGWYLLLPKTLGFATMTGTRTATLYGLDFHARAARIESDTPSNLPAS